MSLKNINQAVITGNTYPVKSDIAELGGKWDSVRKAWIVKIAGHPMNTMAKRGALKSRLDEFCNKGCQVEYT